MEHTVATCLPPPSDHHLHLKGIGHVKHGGVFLNPVFARQVEGGTRRHGQFLRGQELDPRQDAENGLRGLVALDGLEVIPGPVAVHLQQNHKLAIGDGIFPRQVEGDIVPGPDGSVIRCIFINVNRIVHPDIAVNQEGLQPFVEIDAGGKGQGPGAHGIHAQFGRIEVVGMAGGDAGEPRHAGDRRHDIAFRQQVVFGHQGQVADAAVTGGGFAIGAGGIDTAGPVSDEGAMIYISIFFVGP